jgi:hypothetical protein
VVLAVIAAPCRAHLHPRLALAAFMPLDAPASPAAPAGAPVRDITHVVPGSRAAPFWRLLRGRSFGASDATRHRAHSRVARREWPRGRARAAVMGQQCCPNSPCQNSATETRVRHHGFGVLRYFCRRTGPGLAAHVRRNGTHPLAEHAPTCKRTTDCFRAQSRCTAPCWFPGQESPQSRFPGHVRRPGSA